MNPRIGVIALEKTRETSPKDEDDLSEILEILSRRFHFKWAITHNPKWVRALADEMENKE